MKINGNIDELIEEVKHRINETDTIEIEAPENGYDIIGDNHIGTSIDTPLREDAFILTDEDKVEIIEGHFKQIMLTLGLDLNDDSLKGTPHRVAKMYVNEIFKGLNPENKPKISVFENKYNYSQMLVEKNINLNSSCEHHFLTHYGESSCSLYVNR